MIDKLGLDGLGGASVRVEPDRGLLGRIDDLQAELAASQAYAAQLREVLELVKRDARHDIPYYAFGDNEAACEMNRLLENIEGYGDEALSLPQDDTALRQWGAELLKEIERGAGSAYEIMCRVSRKVSELEGKK